MKTTAILLCALPFAMFAQTKLIKLGWDSPDAAFLRKNVEMVEKALPLDGIVISLPRKTKDGKPDVEYGHLVFKNEAISPDLIKSWQDDLLATRFEKLKNNFVRISCAGADYSFFDDQAWNTVIKNIGLVAAAAKKSGLKGIFFDIEHYNYGKPALFQYLPASGKSYAETAAKARQRGAEVMRAMSRDFPDIIVFTVLGSFSINYPALNSADPEKYLANAQYGLSTAFFNGMLDAIPPQAKLFDGDETAGYTASNAEEFYLISKNFMKKAPLLVSPENRVKYQTQCQPAIGVFLDCYLNENGFWVIKSPGMDRLALFRRNLRLALECSGEYAWLYTEQCRWHPIELPPVVENAMKKNIGGGRLWEEAMPGVTESVRFAMNPDKFAAEAKRTPVYSNDFTKGLGDIQQWQGGTVKGKIEQKDGAARLDGVRYGSLFKAVKVNPGEVYLVRAAAKTEGDGQSSLTVTWQDDKRKFIKSADNIKLAFSEKLPDQWFGASKTVIVPENVAFMVVQYCAASATGKAAVSFDNLEIFRIF